MYEFKRILLVLSIAFFTISIDAQYYLNTTKYTEGNSTEMIYKNTRFEIDLDENELKVIQNRKTTSYFIWDSTVKPEKYFTDHVEMATVFECESVNGSKHLFVLFTHEYNSGITKVSMGHSNQSTKKMIIYYQ